MIGRDIAKILSLIVYLVRVGDCLKVKREAMVNGAVGTV